MIRKKNLYSRPRKPFEKVRIEEENELRKEYGLKNKTEIWKALAKVNYFRKRAMALANASIGEKEVFLRKLNDMGLKVNSTADVLALEVRDFLNRRLPSVVAKKGLANTMKQARQMVVHKRIIIGDRMVNSPSYIVRVDEEDKIGVKENFMAHSQSSMKFSNGQLPKKLDINNAIVHKKKAGKEITNDAVTEGGAQNE